MYRIYQTDNTGQVEEAAERLEDGLLREAVLGFCSLLEHELCGRQGKTERSRDQIMKALEGQNAKCRAQFKIYYQEK